MKRLVGLKKAKRNWKITFVWLAISCLSVIAVFIPAIGQAPGGGLSLTGSLLSLLAAGCVVLAFVHTWCKLWKYLSLLGASIVGFGIFVFLHNFFYALAEVTSNIVVLHYLLEFLHAGSFLIAILVCPGAFLVGAAGSGVMSFKIGLTTAKKGQKVVSILVAISCVALIIAFFVFVVARVLD